MSDKSQTLNDTLEQGETIRWSGTAQPYSLFGASHKKATMISLCWAAAWAIILVGGYAASAVFQDLEIQTGVMAFCIAVPLFVLWMPVSNQKKIQKLLYAVTDKRVIVLSDKPMSMLITAVDGIRVDEADDGNCHVRVGSSTFNASSKKLPELAWRGQSNDQDGEKVYTGLVFFNVRDEDEKTIRRLLQATAPTAGA